MENVVEDDMPRSIHGDGIHTKVKRTSEFSPVFPTIDVSHDAVSCLVLPRRDRSEGDLVDWLQNNALIGR